MEGAGEKLGSLTSYFHPFHRKPMEINGLNGRCVRDESVEGWGSLWHCELTVQLSLVLCGGLTHPIFLPRAQPPCSRMYLGASVLIKVFSDMDKKASLFHSAREQDRR